MAKLAEKYAYSFALISYLILHTNVITYGQKKVIDTEAIKNWPRFNKQSPLISPDGKFLVYWIGNYASKYSLMTVKSIAGSWSREFLGGEEAVFTDNSELLIFIGGENLSILDLDNDIVENISNVKSFKLNDTKGQSYIAYSLNDTLRSLVIKDLNSGKQKRFINTENYNFSSSGNRLAIETRIPNDKTYKQQITATVLMLPSLEISVIPVKNDIENFIFDETGNQLIIFSKYQNRNFVYYCRLDRDLTCRIISDSSQGMDGLVLDNQSPGFSKSGNTLYLYVRNAVNITIKNKLQNAEVSVWNAQSDKLMKTPYRQNYLSAVQLQSSVFLVRRLQFESDFIQSTPETDFTLMWRESENYSRDWYYCSPGGEKVFMSKKRVGGLMVSPKQKYLFWYDESKRSWFAYDIKKRIKQEITKQFEELLYALDDHTEPDGEYMFGWSTNDEYIFIYDRYDIWQIDPLGKQSPRNITCGYGKKTGIRLRALTRIKANIVLDKLDSLVLMGYNPNTKIKGYFRLEKDGGSSLKVVQLSYGTMSTPFPSRQGNNSIAISGFDLPLLPIKAKYANIHLLFRSDAEHYPNLFVTKDFTHFDQLTDIAPHKQYNWYKTELIHWKMKKRQTGLGIVFKPENFDSNKRYPVIFYYYEKSSDAFNMFIQPELNNGAMNIPFMVSRGYIVVVPDICYKLGFVGKSAFEYVVSAANCMKRFPWVDEKHMGIHGHSFGGFETNYIVTHTNVFAAAAPASAVSDLISVYNNGYVNQRYYEFGQGRMGTTLWQNKLGYVNGSPIMNADRVNTPILFMHNENDNAVVFSQSLEFFNALTRLNKKAWLVKYRGEGHTISKEQNQIDYTNKLTEFFDHYLKGAPLPEWMN
jgi:dienelactone hydrolase